MLIYLNRTGFNGLFRVNASGAFNVPAGRYERPKILDRERLLARRRTRCAIRACGSSYGSFERAFEAASAGDFLYVDPPYAPLSGTANFTSYTARRFDGRDQEALQQAIVMLARRGCQVLLSNSTAKEIAALYDANVEASGAGLRALRVPARRAINSNGARRGPVEEYLITNISRSGHRDAQPYNGSVTRKWRNWQTRRT